MMQKQLILALGVFLSSYLPAGAQTRSTHLSLIQERPPPGTTLLAAAPKPFFDDYLSPARPLAQPTAHFIVSVTAAYNRDRSPSWLAPVEVVKTPFVRQVRVTVVSLWGGRLQLGGFASTRRRDNVLLGFPGFGGPALPGVRVPRANRSYGLSLTFRLGRDAHADRRVK